MCMVLLPRVFHVWLTLRMLSFVMDLVLVGSSNVSCAIVIYLSYCYGDQLSFAAFACLLRDPRYYSGDEGGISSESISLEAVLTDLSWQALLAGGWKPSTQTWSRSRYIWRPLLHVPITKYKIIPNPNPNPNTKTTVNTIPTQM